MNARIALLGFSIECNRWAPVATLRDFDTRCLLRGADIVADARAASPSALGEMPGFVTTMDAAGPWTPCPIMLAMAEPNGPVEQAVFDGFMAEWRAGLEALRGACDGVYAVLTGLFLQKKKKKSAFSPMCLNGALFRCGTWTRFTKFRACCTSKGLIV